MNKYGVAAIFYLVAIVIVVGLWHLPARADGKIITLPERVGVFSDVSVTTLCDHGNRLYVAHTYTVPESVAVAVVPAGKGCMQ